ncbi:MAG: type II toxin-antitoxin system Phd/YefM family antitoxin [Deltaproteobacteria bacterium]|nr:type II toxin-antitoxin system Phd/YefM family antitoxin [Deltaproteobacteria bacterium]
MEHQFPISKAKDNLPSIIHHIVEEGSVVRLTRHGKPVAMLLSIAQYQRLTQQKSDFWETLTAFRKSCDPADLLTDEDGFSETRDRSEGRTIHFES